MAIPRGPTSIRNLNPTNKKGRLNQTRTSQKTFRRGNFPVQAERSPISKPTQFKPNGPHEAGSSSASTALNLMLCESGRKNRPLRQSLDLQPVWPKRSVCSPSKRLKSTGSRSVLIRALRHTVRGFEHGMHLKPHCSSASARNAS